MLGSPAGSASSDLVQGLKAGDEVAAKPVKVDDCECLIERCRLGAQACPELVCPSEVRLCGVELAPLREDLAAVVQ